MPGRQRVDAATAQNVIAAAFPQEWLALDARETRLALEEFARSEITGGSVYDALIATTARLRGAALLSLDRRAASTYERVAAEYRLL